MTAYNINAWLSGDLKTFILSFNYQNDVYEALPILLCPETPGKKITFLQLLNNRLSLPASIWIRLITQDNNIEIFNTFYKEEFNIKTLHLYLENAPACAWEFVKTHDNIDNFAIYEKAVEYATKCNSPNIDSASATSLVYAKLQKIWHVSLTYKFLVLHRINGSVTTEQLYELYSTSDIMTAISTPELSKINYIHVVDALIDILPSIQWRTDQQVLILTNLANTINVSIPRVCYILENTMCKFAMLQQRQIWKKLKAPEREFYENLDWIGAISTSVLPPHASMGESLFKILKARERIYDYESELISYCEISHPSILSDSLKHNLLGINTSALWSRLDYTRIKVLVLHWNSRIDSALNETDLAIQNVVAAINRNDIGMLVKKQILPYIERVIDIIPSTSKLFKAVLSEPLPADFSPSHKLRQYVYCSIPSMLTPSLYTEYKHEIVDTIINHEITVFNSIAVLLIDDLVNERIRVHGGVINAVTLPVLKLFSSELAMKLYNFISTRLDQNFCCKRDQITSKKSYVNPNIPAELSKRLDMVHLPDEIAYIQYIAEYYGLQNVNISTLVMTSPIVINLQTVDYSYSNLFLLYSHYSECDDEHLLHITTNVLVDMLEKNYQLQLAHTIFFKYCTEPYSLSNTMLQNISTELLLDHCNFGKLCVNPSQYPYFTAEMLLIMKHDCVYCNGATGNGQMITLVCGHNFHRGCLCKWSQQDDLCPLCIVHSAQ